MQDVVFIVSILPDIDSYQVQNMMSQSHIRAASLGCRRAGSPGSVVLRASTGPGNLLGCEFLGLIQHLLNLKFCGGWGAATCALRSLPGYSDGYLNLRTTKLGPLVFLKASVTSRRLRLGSTPHPSLNLLNDHPRQAARRASLSPQHISAQEASTKFRPSWGAVLSILASAS